MVKVEAYYTQNEHGSGAGFSTGGPRFDDNYIKINNNNYPMPFVSYAYTYGFIYLHKDDKISIFNESSNKELTYDNLTDSAKANTSIFTKGENNEIVVNKDGKYLIQLNNNEIQIETIYTPITTSSVQVNFITNREAVNLDSNNKLEAIDVYRDLYTIRETENPVTNFNDAKTAFKTSEQNIFSKTLELRKNEKFVIKDVTNNQNISGTNYSLTLEKDIYNDFTFN